ncbi:hypothetical protein NQ317_018192 [Molorchus minor]|uniref:Protein kinase domain-containing protein n=1 Tax=Molorchus minor TaxID=1323400 RepID=A0ABQ9JYU3_9CUCU|nr:hypothetical protein NQ317_018192 [Molorchus minor]
MMAVKEIPLQHNDNITIKRVAEEMKILEGIAYRNLVRRYTFQLVSGVVCLHEHGIAHRDIKTANIFLTEGGRQLFENR